MINHPEFTQEYLIRQILLLEQENKELKGRLEGYEQEEAVEAKDNILQFPSQGKALCKRV